LAISASSLPTRSAVGWVSAWARCVSWLAPKGVEGVREGFWAISCPCVPLPPTPDSTSARKRYIQNNFLLV